MPRCPLVSAYIRAFLVPGAGQQLTDVARDLAAERLQLAAEALDLGAQPVVVPAQPVII